MKRIGVGIPTLNEAPTVGRTVQLVDRGLRGLTADGIIINSDSGSSDGTVGIFQETRTASHKICAPPRPGRPGKGANVLGILEQAGRLSVDALVLVDADVTSMREDWVPLLAEPVVTGVADYASACYVASQGGPLRHLVSRPVVCGLLGADIPQPTGGEAAMSRALVERLRARSWQGSDLGYGIDIAIAAYVAAGAIPFAAVDLGTKTHRPRRWSTIDAIAVEVVESALRAVARLARRPNLQARAPVHAVPSTKVVTAPSPQIMDLNRAADRWRAERTAYAALYARLLGEPVLGVVSGDDAAEFTGETWTACLLAFVRSARAGEDPAVLARAMMPLFLGRMAAFGDELTADGPETVADRLRRDLENSLAIFL